MTAPNESTAIVTLSYSFVIGVLTVNELHNTLYPDGDNFEVI